MCRGVGESGYRGGRVRAGGGDGVGIFRRKAGGGSCWSLEVSGSDLRSYCSVKTFEASGGTGSLLTCPVCSPASHITKDMLPGPYPKTPEERAAAAKKYNMRVEDYEPYPDDGMG